METIDGDAIDSRFLGGGGRRFAAVTTAQEAVALVLDLVQPIVARRAALERVRSCGSIRGGRSSILPFYQSYVIIGGMRPDRVAVIFEQGKLRPVWIERRGKKIDVKEVTYEWTSTLGKELLRHYSISDGTNLYELIFNPATLEWTVS